MKHSKRKHHYKQRSRRRWKPSGGRRSRGLRRAGIAAGSALSLALALGGSAPAHV